MGISYFRNTLVRIRNSYQIVEAQRAGGQLWEENSLWEVAGDLPPPTSLNLHPGRGKFHFQGACKRPVGAAESHYVHRCTSKCACFCSHLFPTLSRGKKKITLCSDLSMTLDKSRPLNDHSQSRLVYPSPKFEHIFVL